MQIIWLVIIHLCNFKNLSLPNDTEHDRISKTIVPDRIQQHISTTYKIFLYLYLQKKKKTVLSRKCTQENKKKNTNIGVS